MKKLDFIKLHKDFIKHTNKDYLFSQNEFRISEIEEFMSLKEILNISYISDEFKEFVKEQFYKQKVEELLK